MRIHFLTVVTQKIKLFQMLFVTRKPVHIILTSFGPVKVQAKVEHQ